MNMESESESSLVSECMAVLRSIHSEISVPDPVVTHQTKWSQDPYARGSYSFVAAGNDGQEYDRLAKPVGRHLFFAGEACSRDYPATVPGAYVSGLRAAGAMQAEIVGWKAMSASPDVMRELAKQPKSEERSKNEMRATAVTQQAVLELGGRGNEAEMQLKIAEILARQKKRRGIRHELPMQQDGDADVKIVPEEVSRQ